MRLLLVLGNADVIAAHADGGDALAGSAQFAIDHVAGTLVGGEDTFGKESGERNNSQQFAPRQIVVLHCRKPPSSQ